MALAKSALGCQELCKAVLKTHLSAVPSSVETSTDVLSEIVGAAQREFNHLWETCHIDLVTIRELCHLTLIISLLFATCSAYPMYDNCFNNNKHSGAYCVFVTGELLLDGLSFCLFLYFIIYSASVILERQLASRRACWNYFCSHCGTGRFECHYEGH